MVAQARCREKGDVNPSSSCGSELMGQKTLAQKGLWLFRNLAALVKRIRTARYVCVFTALPNGEIDIIKCKGTKETGHQVSIFHSEHPSSKAVKDYCTPKDRRTDQPANSATNLFIVKLHSSNTLSQNIFLYR